MNSVNELRTLCWVQQILKVILRYYCANNLWLKRYKKSSFMAVNFLFINELAFQIRSSYKVKFRLLYKKQYCENFTSLS